MNPDQIRNLALRVRTDIQYISDLMFTKAAPNKAALEVMKEDLMKVAIVLDSVVKMVDATGAPGESHGSPVL